jgi:hypothetical protein
MKFRAYFLFSRVVVTVSHNCWQIGPATKSKVPSVPAGQNKILLFSLGPGLALSVVRDLHHRVASNSTK